MIEPAAAENYAFLLHQILSGTRSSFWDDDDEEQTEYAWLVDIDGNRIGAISDHVKETAAVAVIDLNGPVMKYDSCSAIGTQSLIKAIQQANANPDVASIVLQIDSPGGSVAGTQLFSNVVKNSKKPVVASINGMMASAALWIGSAAAERIATANTDVIGSIGTMASWLNFSKYYEKLNIAKHEVYASASTDKNKDFREANAGNYEPLIKTWLDPLNNEFIGAIKENIPDANKSVFSGATYLAKNAISLGLIDSINTFDYAVKRSLQLANSIK